MSRGVRQCTQKTFKAFALDGRHLQKPQADHRAAVLGGRGPHHVGAGRKRILAWVLDAVLGQDQRQLDRAAFGERLTQEHGDPAVRDVAGLRDQGVAVGLDFGGDDDAEAGLLSTALHAVAPSMRRNAPFVKTSSSASISAMRTLR